jgi:hypothetical protein
VFFFILASCGEGAGGVGNSASQGGSTSRFVVTHGHLYVLNEGEEIISYSLAEPNKPTFKHSMFIGAANAETLHGSGEHLFVGMDNGMLVVSLADPAEPKIKARVGHFVARDPVVVEGDKAYVTLRGERNVLQIYDVARMESPIHIATYPMSSPFGLAAARGRAFICDGSRGLVTLDVSEPSAVRETANLSDNICFDALVNESSLITTGATGLHQYSLSGATPTLLSHIKGK